MSKMEALFYMGPRQLELKKVDIPESGSSVIVKVLGAGICGTDIKAYLRGHHMFQPPTVLGHECYGIVVDKPSFLGDLTIGDYVVIAPYAECGICETCLKGFPELCGRKTFLDGGCFVQYVRVPVRHALRGLFKVNTPGKHTILTEPLACVLGALRKLPRAERFLVVGGGVMGALFGIYLRSRGKEVKIVEISQWRRQFLEKLGFSVLEVDSLKSERVYDVVVVASTIEDPLEYFELLRDGGCLMLFGGYPKNQRLTMDPYHIHYREISVVGSFGYSLPDFVSATKELERNSGELYSHLITHEYHVSDYQEAFNTAIRKECMKVVLRMWNDEEV